jgi:hypothetical protein
MVVLAGSLPPGVFPIILFSLGEPNDNEIAVGKRQIPTKFQYRIVPMTFPFDVQHRPWKSERETLMSQTSRCADLLANRDIRIRRDGKTTTENVRLDPLPLEQTWEGITFKSEREGIQRHFLSSCCNQAECKDRCLKFPEGERWMLEILTPQWGVDEVRVVSSLVNQGGSSREFYVVQEDPGVWPVLRVPCLYCPLKSCISNCSNGEYSTGLTDVVVSAFFYKTGGFFLADTRVLAERPAGQPHRVQALPARDVEHVHEPAKLQMGDPLGQGPGPGQGHPPPAWRAWYAYLILATPSLSD